MGNVQQIDFFIIITEIVIVSRIFPKPTEFTCSIFLILILIILFFKFISLINSVWWPVDGAGDTRVTSKQILMLKIQILNVSKGTMNNCH